MNDSIDRDAMGSVQARELLERADRIGGSVRTGAGWPQIASLLGLGAVSSMGVVALTLAARVADTR